LTRQLAIYDTQTRRLEGLDPGNATGIAVPTVRIVAVRPAAGTIAGELIYERQSGSALLWDGAAWQLVQSDFLHAVDTDADALAAVLPVGTMILSKTTGNVFLVTNGGTTRWGITNYTTTAQLLADVQPDGTLALADDEAVFWKRHAGAWVPLGARPFANLAAIRAWAAAPAGAEVVDRATGARLHRVGAAWAPRSIITNTSAAILALGAADVADGQVAVTTDTNQMFVYNVGSGWIGSPVRYYATEAALLADAPAAGTLAFGEDTGLVYGRTAAGWRRVNSPTITVAIVNPTTPATGDLLFNPTLKRLYIRTATAWEEVSSRVTLGAAPASPQTGDLWGDTSNGGLALQLRTAGAAWQRLTPWRGFLTANNANSAIGLPSGCSHVRMKGVVVPEAANSQLALIAQMNNNWIDWGTLGFLPPALEVNPSYYGFMNMRWEANGAFAADNISATWNTAGAALSTITWWAHRYVDVDVEIERMSNVAPPLTLLRFSLQGRDPSGNIRLARGAGILNTIFPLTHVGLKMLDSTGAGRTMVTVEAT
jgi:hypothetical protein